MSLEEYRKEVWCVRTIPVGSNLENDSAAKPPPLLGSIGKRAKVIYGFERAWGLKGERDRDG
jgi:hypothetical protein